MPFSCCSGWRNWSVLVFLSWTAAEPLLPPAMYECCWCLSRRPLFYHYPRGEDLPGWAAATAVSSKSSAYRRNNGMQGAEARLLAGDDLRRRHNTRTCDIALLVALLYPPADLEVLKSIPYLGPGLPATSRFWVPIGRFGSSPCDAMRTIMSDTGSGDQTGFARATCVCALGDILCCIAIVIL